ncbi:MAG: TIM barrel protein [Bacteroidales bacterium]|nr:TIM barrel protein [Bacteroidales bacterium]
MFLFGTVGIPKSTHKKPGGTIGGITRLRELTLEALENGWVRSVRVSEAICAEIKSCGINNQVKISVHAPYYINLNAEEDEWSKSRIRLIDAAFFGFLADATDVIFHPGSYLNQKPDLVLDLATRRLTECVMELKSKNITINLRPETMGKSTLIGSIEDVLKLGYQIDSVLPCLDFAHLHARAGDGTMNSYREWSDLLDLYQSYLGEESLSHLHIHLSGIEYSNKGEKKHSELLKSDFRTQELFQCLKDKGCSGRILCESPILEEDAILLKNLWEGMQ